MTTGTHDANNADASPRYARTGIPGFDSVLRGGLPRDRVYLIQGGPGAGKTTLGLQFLLEGARQGETGMYVTLSESEGELRDIARSHDWLLDRIAICDLQRSEESLSADAQYTLFHPSEIELSETTRSLLEMFDRVKPTRIVFDSMSELRLLARDPLRYRRQILALKHYFTERQCTVLLLDTQTSDEESTVPLESLAHGVITLEQLAPEFGGQRRRLRVKKIRGSVFADGFHDFLIRRGGIEVFPRLIASESPGSPPRDPAPSGLATLDAMVGGGLERGTSAIFLGPSGSGKSTLASHFLVAAASRGERGVLYTFDENPATWLARSEGLGLGVRKYVESGAIRLEQMNPAQVSPGEFAREVHDRVLGDGSRIVVLDSLNGFLSGMPHERFLSLHLHELLAFLNQQGVLTLLIMAQHGLVGDALDSPLELSYLADTVFLLRYFEAEGRMRQAISVVKKRTGNHERTIRELRFGGRGIEFGPPLAEFQGILSGNPRFVGASKDLLQHAE